MLSNLRVNPGAKRIDNLPEGWVTLFLAKTTMEGKPCFGAVFGPASTCWPQNSHTDAELYDAKVGVFDETGNLSSTHDVRGGNKYVEGGGIVYLDGTGETIMWTGVDECGRNEFLGERITLKNVIVTT